MPITDLHQRIKRAHEMDESNAGKEPGCLLDANWLQVRELLVQLYENLPGKYSHYIIEVILLKLDAEVLVIEALVNCLPSRGRRGSLH